MSPHHGKKIDDEALGETGDFPKGKLNEDDEGGLRFAVGSDIKTKKVLLDFGKPIAWIGLDPSDARRLAQLLTLSAARAEMGGNA